MYELSWWKVLRVFFFIHFILCGRKRWTQQRWSNRQLWMEIKFWGWKVSSCRRINSSIAKSRFFGFNSNFSSLIISLFARRILKICKLWLTQNEYHILLPLLQLTLYKSPFLNASKIWTIRHFFESTEFSWTLWTATQCNNVEFLINSLATISDDGLKTSWFICNSVGVRGIEMKNLWRTRVCERRRRCHEFEFPPSFSSSCSQNVSLADRKWTNQKW